ncbi:MAG: hypothetical protein HN576_13105 [Bacteriovoracaceae bacterium]|jgi:hypothetical protein|nr:hypothetical protein [Bacteriovoracaceae bacterium]
MKSMRLNIVTFISLILISDTALCQQPSQNIFENEQQSKTKLYKLFKAKSNRHFFFLFVKNKGQNNAYVNAFKKVPIHKMTFYDRYILGFYFLGLIPKANKDQLDPGYVLELLNGLSKDKFNSAISFLRAYAQDLLSRNTKEIRAQIETILKNKSFSLQEAVIYKNLVNKLHASNFFVHDYSYVAWIGLSANSLNGFHIGSMMKFFYRMRDQKVITNEELFILGQKFFKSTVHYKQNLVGMVSKIIGLRIQQNAISKQMELENKFKITSKKLKERENEFKVIAPMTPLEAKEMIVLGEFLQLRNSKADIKAWYSIPQNKMKLDAAIHNNLGVKEIKGLID